MLPTLSLLAAMQVVITCSVIKVGIMTTHDFQSWCNSLSPAAPPCTHNQHHSVTTIDCNSTECHTLYLVSMTSIMHVWQRRTWLLPTTSVLPLYTLCPWSRLNPTSKAACVCSQQGPASCHKIMVSSTFRQIQNDFSNWNILTYVSTYIEIPPFFSRKCLYSTPTPLQPTHKWHVNLLWPRDAIWCHKFWSTLVHLMACCLTAPSHYLNQCWLTIWHSSQGNIYLNTPDINSQTVWNLYFRNHTLISQGTMS